MLTPAKTDPNCKKEEARKKKTPQDFGEFAGGNKQPKDFKGNIGLKKASTDVKEEDVEEVIVLTVEERTAAALAVIELLEQYGVGMAKDGLPDLAFVIAETGIEDLTTEEVNAVFFEHWELEPEEVRLAAIVHAISNLEEGNDKHFTGDGSPRVEVLEADTGIADITADERTEAFTAFNDNKDT